MYVDDNGIVRFENTDDLSPLHVQLNIALQSISDRVGSLEPDQITNGDQFLRIDGNGRVYSSEWFNREYTGNRPDGTTNRLAVITPVGTMGTLATTLSHDYMPYRLAAGVINIPIGGDWSTVTLPAGRFTVPPLVLVSVGSSAGDSTGVTLRTQQTTVTTASFRVHASDTGGRGGTSTTIVWYAVQV